MATSNIYGGMFGTTAITSNPEDYGNFTGYRMPASAMGLSLDPRTANQLGEFSRQVSTGVKTIEIQGVTPDVLESIPEQHLVEIKRLNKLVGTELTLHGPLIEATGISQEGWSEDKRLQAERQMWSAIERGNKLDPKGNINITFHTTSGLPEMQTRVIETIDGKKQEVVKEMLVVNEKGNQFQRIRPEIDYLEGKKPSVDEAIKKINAEAWSQRIDQASYYSHLAQQSILDKIDKLEKASPELKEKMGGEILNKDKILSLYKLYGTQEGNQALANLPEGVRKFIEREIVSDLNFGKVRNRAAYNELKNLYEQAYLSAKKNQNEYELSRLESYSKEVQGKLDYVDNPEKLQEFSEMVQKGINILSSLKAPEIFRPLNDFAIEKASETYSNLALRAYEKFQDSAPIISLENPPAGGGISRAEDMRQLIEKTRNEFVRKAVQSGALSESEAKKQSEKLIGATWDVGHINMLRKYGYDKADLKKQAETIAPFVKHVHLSDNFGYEHTELPMGMGNVPTEDHLKAIAQYNEKAKKIIETGNWYQHFKTSPLPESLEAFGSPIYAMSMSPYWNQAAGTQGGYFAGYGLNPDIHHSSYGAGFSTLPVELGGQIAGRSRISGTPME